VKPIPAIVPPPATAAQPTGGRSRPPVNRVSSHELPRMPTGLPTTEPKKIPSVIGEVIARPRKALPTAMPAFASAKTGTIT
jgi:hypothetical protein